MLLPSTCKHDFWGKNSAMNKTLNELLAIDIFCGCGGLTAGLEAAGFKVIAGAEIDESAKKVYELNHPMVHLFGNVKKLKAGEIFKKLKIVKGELDLLAGCPPCQGFSKMRTKNKAVPARDSRNKLIFEFVRLVRELLPKTVMIENVPGLESDWRLTRTKKMLKCLGYKTAVKVVNAADYGVPQRRKRMILMGSRLGEISIPEVKLRHRTVRQVIGKLPRPSESSIGLHKLLADHNEEVLKRIRLIPKDGGSRSALGDKGQLNCHKKLGSGFRDVYGRMKWDAVSPTITRFCSNPSKGRFLHPRQNRAISPYEAALIQTFPKRYKFPIDLGRTAITSMIGEALPPLLAKKQSAYLFSHLKSLN
jgi:DNA (cytosine-5)-methyltransferase 1